MTARHRAAGHRAVGHPATTRYVVVGAALGVLALAALVFVVVLPQSSESVTTSGHGQVGPGAVHPLSGSVAPGLKVIGADPAAPATAAVAEPPVRVRIPAIGVDSGLQRLGLLANGTLQPPSHWAVAGWYAGGPAPGQVGPAVIAGHVDSTKGPAVFYRLKALKPGDRILVDVRGGRSMTFEVDTVQRFKKSAFPTETVYGAVPDPELRLVTCTGTFDRSARSYLDNLVVSAHLVGA